MSTSNLQLIETSKLFTESECVEIVRKTLKRESVSVKSVELFGNKGVFGFLGEYFRLVIHVNNDDNVAENDTNNESKPFIYFIKSLPLENELKRNHIEKFNMFNKEWFMYSELLPKLRKENDSSYWHAKCYLARPDVLVLEDLTELGYSHLQYRNRFNTAMIECCLRNVAQLHADGIAYVETVLKNEKFEEKYANYLNEISIREDDDWFLCGLRAVKGCAPLAKNFHKYKDEWSDEDFDKRIKRTYEIVQPSKVYRNVLCHQDLWANNIMFKFEPMPNSNEPDLNRPINSVFMDFQFFRYTPPALDVLQLLTMTTRLDYRRQNYETHFKYYYERLRDELKVRGFDVNEILPWDEFRSSCDDLLMFPVIYNCVATPLVYLKPEKQLKMKNEDAAKFHYYLFVDRMEYMLEGMADDEQFKDVVMENIEELLDLLYGGNKNNFT